MNPTNVLFLSILKAGLQGQQAAPDREIPAEEWQTLVQMAGEHKVLPLFFESAFPLLRQTAPALSDAVKRQVRSQVFLQTQRTEEFLALNRALISAGVTPLVVKGIVCRNLYPKPDHRPSADEDVLIHPEQLETCRRILAGSGMTTDMDPAEQLDAYEIPYRKPGSPLYIELHKHLFPPESDAYGDLNRFFEDASDRAISLQIRGNTVSTLDQTDHLFYLICHAFKHFLHSGFGIRQICDILLFANHYGSSIDWDLVLENCRAIRAEQFAAALFQIGSRHLIFDPDSACLSDAWRQITVDETALLEDVLCAGIYGSAESSRLHSSTITLDAVAAQKQNKRPPIAGLGALFPPAKTLKGRYPYLKKHPYLLPIAWCSRLRTYLMEAQHTSDNSAADALKIGSERIALLRQYGILK